MPARQATADPLPRGADAAQPDHLACLRRPVRVRDLRYIVGYLHAIDDGYEMLWMRPHPGVVYRHPDFESAVDAITVRLELTSDAR